MIARAHHEEGFLLKSFKMLQNGNHLALPWNRRCHFKEITSDNDRIKLSSYLLKPVILLEGVVEIGNQEYVHK
jgi:hypothetical protein